MNWESITFASVGFGLYCFALVLKSTSLKHLRFARIIDLAAPEAASARNRAWVASAALVASVILMGIALWQSIENDRSAFWMLAGLGAILVAIRLVGFFFTHVSLVVLEIETDPASKLSFAHLSRSPLILGGLTLMVVSSATPIVLDRHFRGLFEGERAAQWHELETAAKREGFNAQSYAPRYLVIGEKGENEKEFFQHVLVPGRRVVIVGRAGIGKTWFLMQTRFDSRQRHPDRAVVFVRAQDLDYERGENWIDHIGRTAFGDLPRGARPAIRSMIGQALILIDGLDEVHAASREKAVAEAVQLANDPGLRASIVVLTTRPIDLDALVELKKRANFDVAQLRPLDESESSDQLKAGSARVARLTASLRAHSAQSSPLRFGVLRLFHTGRLPDLQTITADETATLLQAFVHNLGFSQRAQDPVTGDFRIPLLSTYRDIDIVADLFLDALTREAGPLAGTPDQMRSQLRHRLIGEFVSRRIKLNYKPSEQIVDLPARVVEALDVECANFLSDMPSATSFRFKSSRFYKAFGGTTLDKVLQESELLILDPASRIMTFDSPAIEEYFYERARFRLDEQLQGRAP